MGIKILALETRESSQPFGSARDNRVFTTADPRINVVTGAICDESKSLQSSSRDADGSIEGSPYVSNLCEGICKVVMMA